jgi:hypothetical protein
MSKKKYRKKKIPKKNVEGWKSRKKKWRPYKNVEKLEDVVKQRIDTLNERYIDNEINLHELLDGLSTFVAKQHK